MIIRAILLTMALAAPAAAQVTLDELDAVADEADQAMTAFRERLNDPDPDRALAVLEALITRGDAAQRRLAIRHGLESTDRAVRATTLRAIFNANPTIRAVFDPVAQEPNTGYGGAIVGAGGVLNEKGDGSVTFKVNGFDAKNDCWTHGRYKKCLIRMRGDAVSLWFGDSWGGYELDGSTGRLVGEQAIARNLTAATIDLSE